MLNILQLFRIADGAAVETIRKLGGLFGDGLDFQVQISRAPWGRSVFSRSATWA
jgi:hypothetical protein